MGPLSDSDDGFSLFAYLHLPGDKILWLLSLMLTPGVIIYIELGRRLDYSVPIPFLLLFAAVVLASSSGGRLVSLLAVLSAGSFAIYATVIDYGPSALTDGVLQLTLGTVLMCLVGYNLGYTRDQNRSLTRSMREHSAALVNQVAQSTADLYNANRELEREVEHQQATAAMLREREEQLAAIINSNIDLICRYTPETILVFVNDTYCRHFGKSREELLGYSFLSPADEVSNHLFYQHIARILAERRPIVNEEKGIDGDGREHWIQWVDTVVEAADGQILIQAVGRDITEQRRGEIQLHQQNQLAAIGQLAAGIAHDFNNILAVISIYAQLLLRDPGTAEASRQKLQIINEQTERAASLTNKILDFSRRSVMSRRRLDLCSLWKSTIDMLRRTLPENIQLELGEAPERLLVFGDETRLQQVFLNLVVNARDALPDGGQIRISLQRLDTLPNAVLNPDQVMVSRYGWAEIRVTDNGTGVDTTVLPHLFEPFFSTKAPGKGTGLGLAQVHGIVKQHGGDVLVDSKLEHGTAFIIYLPALAEDEIAIDDSPDNQPVIGRGELLLLVEDDANVLSALVSGINALNYRTITAANGVEALAILQSATEKIDLVISDAVMPEMGGAALLAEMQAAGLAIPLIIVTGHPLGSQLEQLRGEGLAAYLSKPYTLEQLSVTIADNLGHRHSAA